MNVPSPLSVAIGPPAGSQPHQGPVILTSVASALTVNERPEAGGGVGPSHADVASEVSISPMSSCLSIQLPGFETLLQRTSNEVDSGAPSFHVKVTFAIPFSRTIADTPAGSL